MRALRGEAVCLAFYTLRNGVNEPGEDFIGTRVGNRIKMRLPMYDVRGTIWKVSARCAGRRRKGAAPQGLTGRVVPVSQGTIWKV